MTPTHLSALLSDAELAEITRRASFARKGPWHWEKCYEMEDGRIHWAICNPDHAVKRQVVSFRLVSLDCTADQQTVDYDAEMQFVAKARNDIPRLLSHIASLTAERDAAVADNAAMLDRLCSCGGRTNKDKSLPRTDIYCEACDEIPTHPGQSILDELAAAQHENAALVKEANRRDQKWMDGIDSIVGRKLDYDLGSDGKGASMGLDTFINDLKRDAATLRAKVGEMALIIEKLPLTADGLRMVPGMEVWCIRHILVEWVGERGTPSYRHEDRVVECDEPQECHVAHLGAYGSEAQRLSVLRRNMSGPWSTLPKWCYSTREAALAQADKHTAIPRPP